LSFAQKVAVARCLSLDESGNSVWEVIEKLNALRNKLSHSLDAVPRAEAMESLRAAYTRECGGKLSEDEDDERVLLASVLSLCLGFVHAFEQEVDRFKGYVAIMDRAVNPHHYKK
jgi:seryl-tRNA synthetase